MISQTQGSVTHYYHYDGLGSTRALSDHTGTLTDTYAYTVFGDLLQQTGTTENRYRFTGEQYDAGLDQYYLRARYYDQGVGRFTQQDSWMGRDSDPMTLHKYLYANGDGVNHTDPSGQMSLASINVSIGTLGILSAYTISVNPLQGFGKNTGDYSNQDIGWLTLAAMSGVETQLHDLVSKKIEAKTDKKVSLSRAVGDTELASLYANQLFILSPNGFEVKQFFHTQSEAIKFGNIFIKGVMNKLYFHTVEVVISDSLYGALDHHAYEPGIGPIVTVPMGLLPAFNFEVNTYGGFKYTGTYY